MTPEDECPATREAVEEMEEAGYGPGCELCDRPAKEHPSEGAAP